MTPERIPAPVLDGLFHDGGSDETGENTRPNLDENEKLKVLIVGGSIAGCCTAIALSSIGCQCSIVEKRSGKMQSQGAGLVVQPDMARFLTLFKVVENLSEVCVESSGRQYVNRRGEIIDQNNTPQLFSAWDVLLAMLMKAVPSAVKFYSGIHVEGVDIGTGSVSVSLSNKGKMTGDILIAADGGGSTVRCKFMSAMHSAYQGYVAWRGLVPEIDLPGFVKEFVDNRFTVHQGEDWCGHILCYFIPGEDGSVEGGERRLNWVWYQNVEAEKLSSILIDKEGVKHGFSIPRGMLRTEVSEEQKQFAARVMPEPLHAMISATKDIFVQAIHDFLAPRHSIEDRIALVGDSGAILRPHTAAGTTKAALNAWSLSSCLQKYNFDVPTALEAYHNAMQPVAKELVDIGISIGTQSQCTEKKFDSHNLPGTWKQQA